MQHCKTGTEESISGRSMWTYARCEIDYIAALVDIVEIIVCHFGSQGLISNAVLYALDTFASSLCCRVVNRVHLCAFRLRASSVSLAVCTLDNCHTLQVTSETVCSTLTICRTFCELTLKGINCRPAMTPATQVNWRFITANVYSN